MEPLQELFGNELKNYEFYSRKIKELWKKIHTLEKRKEELEQIENIRKKTDIAIENLRKIEISGKVDLPQIPFSEVMQSLSDFRMQESKKEEIAKVNETLSILEEVLNEFKSRKKECLKYLF